MDDGQTLPQGIVVSLEWAKKLKEAGWPQESSYFYWRQLGGCAQLCDRAPSPVMVAEGGFYEYDAPTAEEVLRNLPRKIKHHDGINVFLAVEPMKTEPGTRWWTVGYVNLQEEPMVAGERRHATSLAAATADMWCYLAENKLLA